MTEEECYKAIETIADHYGLSHQLNKTVEELGELLAEISRYKATIDAGKEVKPMDRKFLIGECVDSYVMIMQLLYLIGDDAYADKTYEKKLKRQIQRINEENYRRERLNEISKRGQSAEVNSEK